MAASVALLMSQEDLEATVRRAVEPLRVELERLRGGNGTVLVSLPEAARLLGVDIRTVQRRARDGRLETEMVGGERIARLPASLAGR